MSITQAPQAEFHDAGKPVAVPVYQVDANGSPLPGASGGAKTATVAATASAIISTQPCRLCRVLITSAGTASLVFYDNAAGTASGVIVGVTPVTTSVGQIYDFNFPTNVGLSAVGQTGSPGVTVSWS
jgi:hypothetical protein